MNNKKRKKPLIEVRPIIGKTKFESFWGELEKTARRVVLYDSTAYSLLNGFTKNEVPDCKIHGPGVGVKIGRASCREECRL